VTVLPPLPSIKDLTQAELEAFFLELGESKFRAQQAMLWLYAKGVSAFTGMTNYGKELREKLAQTLRLNAPEVGEMLESEDGTRKFTLVLHDNRRVESVIIPDGKRVTLCVSTQAGCKRGCKLCATARMGFLRNLSSGEILDQIIAANHLLNGSKRVTHVVFMGMGEPMDNLDEVLKSLRIIHSDYGFCISPGRTTVSTVGVLEGMRRLAKEGSGEGLAVSLHASDDMTRKKLIPLAHKVTIREILEECKAYAKVSGDKVTFEYVMVRGVNCSPEDGRRLAKLLAVLPAKINLIPYNEAAGGDFEAPSDEEIDAFKQELWKGPAIVTLRRSRGRDIRAACGQLCVMKEGK
jgi:23S rRNA (adenine2503-C2)-methyltransferase